MRAGAKIQVEEHRLHAEQQRAQQSARVVVSVPSVYVAVLCSTAIRTFQGLLTTLATKDNGCELKSCLLIGSYHCGAATHGMASNVPDSIYLCTDCTCILYVTSNPTRCMQAARSVSPTANMP